MKRLLLTAYIAVLAGPFLTTQIQQLQVKFRGALTQSEYHKIAQIIETVEGVQ